MKQRNVTVIFRTYNVEISPSWCCITETFRQRVCCCCDTEGQDTVVVMSQQQDIRHQTPNIGVKKLLLTWRSGSSLVSRLQTAVIEDPQFLERSGTCRQGQEVCRNVIKDNSLTEVKHGAVFRQCALKCASIAQYGDQVLVLCLEQMFVQFCRLQHPEIPPR